MLNRWIFLIVVSCVAIVYVQALGAPFIWDDRHLVLNSPLVTDGAALWEYFLQPFWTETAADATRAYYRPLTVLSLRLDHLLHGQNAGGYHLTNVLLHMVNAGLLAALLGKHRVAPRSACLLTLAWALSPRLTEATAWISGRTDVLATTFVFLALLIHRSGNLWRACLVALSLFFGLLAKEVALGGVAAIVVAELVSTDEQRTSPLTRFNCLVPLACVLLGYFLLRSHALRDVGSAETTLSLGQRAASGFEALGRYAASVAIPWRPDVQQGLLRHPVWPFVALGVAVLATGAVWFARGVPSEFRKAVQRDVESQLRLLALALGITSLGLVLHVVPITAIVVSADRFLYLPLAAFAMALAHPLSRWLERSKVAMPLALAYVFSLAAACFVRVGVWGDELRFWEIAYRSTPPINGVPANELGNVYYRAGLYEQALAIYRKAAEKSEPGIPGPRENVANALSQLGQYAQASEIRLQRCTVGANADDCLAAARVALHMLDLDAARSRVREAQKRAPQLEDTSKVLAQIDAVETALKDTALVSSDPAARTAAQFRVMVLAGKRKDALVLAEMLLREPGVSAREKTEAAEYWVRWGQPDQIQRVLSSASVGTEFADDLLIAAQYRATEAQRLLEAWPALDIRS